MFTGIEFNGKHSYKDFGLTVSSKKIGDPSKKKIIEEVPHSNISYDFSGIYGGQTYTERSLLYVFNIIEKSLTKEEFQNIRTLVVNWLSSAIGKSTLRDDEIPYYHFMAEYVEASDYERYKNLGGTLSVTFTAYPFKVHDLEEGNDIWDSFNFLLDYAQDTSFSISGSKTIAILNPGIVLAYPKIVASANFQVLKDGTTYSIPAGTTTSYDFSFSTGKNTLTIIGNGTISFHFHKELI